MSPKYLVRLRWFAYSAFIALWTIAFYLIKTDSFHYFSGADWIVYYVTALAWATGGSVFLFWKHRRDVSPRRPFGGYKLNWSREDGIFAPRETV